ncbi:hypothetical protein RRG08_060069 [Elysia crispata]|uniref:Uncharacterized protein n=1 Tax=Elysia crispata TaxID=231223 RepID=A0AAE1CQH9_9GAST|nr:hypothetical protein RRG08_060069 [Elysia crispata]
MVLPHIGCNGMTRTFRSGAPWIVTVGRRPVRDYESTARGEVDVDVGTRGNCEVLLSTRAEQQTPVSERDGSCLGLIKPRAFSGRPQ